MKKTNNSINPSAKVLDFFAAITSSNDETVKQKSKLWNFDF